MIKFNYDKITLDTGIIFENEEALFDYVIRLLDYLMLHNKNYTKVQYRKIEDLYYILKNIEVE